MRLYLCHLPLAPAEKPKIFPTAIQEQNIALAELHWSGPVTTLVPLLTKFCGKNNSPRKKITLHILEQFEDNRKIFHLKDQPGAHVLDPTFDAK